MQYRILCGVAFSTKCVRKRKRGTYLQEGYKTRKEIPSLIEAVRDEIGIYLQDLELALFEKSRKAFAQAFRHVLKHLDIVIRDKRDPRFEAKERVGTTLKTLLGVQVSFKRRRYNDTVTGDSVYLLDEVLGMVEGTQTSPALVKLMLHLRL